MKTVAELRAELEKLNQQIKAAKELQIPRVSNRSMFKRQKLESIIKGK
jgi:hypothetical protein